MRNITLTAAAEELGIQPRTMRKLADEGRVVGIHRVYESERGPRGDRWLVSSPVQIVPRPWYSMTEAGQALGLSRARIYQLVQSGELEAYRGTGNPGPWRITPEALERVALTRYPDRVPQ